MALRRALHCTLQSVHGLPCYSMSPKKFLTTSVNDKTGIITLTMNRPPVNSFNLEFLKELSETFDTMEKSKPAGVIITSFSDKVFSAGLDLNEMFKPDAVRLKTFMKCLQEVMIKLYGSSYPTAAVINGHAPAGGCMIALCCEYRTMVNNFTIGLNETRVGIVAPLGLILTMQNTIHKRHAELALTSGELFKTNEALKIGLIDEIASNKVDAMEKATAFFKRYENMNRVARASTKNCLRGPDIEVMHKTREEVVENMASLILQPDVQQNIEHYFTKIKSKK